MPSLMRSVAVPAAARAAAAVLGFSWNLAANSCGPQFCGQIGGQFLYASHHHQLSEAGKKGQSFIQLMSASNLVITGDHRSQTRSSLLRKRYLSGSCHPRRRGRCSHRAGGRRPADAADGQRSSYTPWSHAGGPAGRRVLPGEDAGGEAAPGGGTG